MVNLLTKVEAKPRFFFRAILCIVVPFALSTALDAAIFRFGASADGSFGAILLNWAYKSFYALTVSAAYTLIVAAIYTKGPKSAAKITLVYALCRLLGEAQEYLLELRSESGASLSDYDRIMSGVSHISEFFAAVSLAFGVWIMSSAFLRLYKTREGKRKYAVRSAVNFAILFEFIVSFARLVVRSGVDLFRADVAPSVDSIRAFVYDAVGTVVFFAIIAFVGSRIVLFICTDRDF